MRTVASKARRLAALAPARAYAMHIEHDDAVVDAAVSVSKESDLPLSTVQNIKDDESRRRATATYRYRDLTTPH